MGRAAFLLAGAGCAGAVWAQEIQLGDAGLAANDAHRQHVEAITPAVQVKAGQPAWVELHFRVAPGFHINSHTPHDELLVPTALAVRGPGTVKVVEQRYPEGVPLRLDTGAGETLSTYQGEFAIRVKVVAPRGETALQTELSYQACDARSCFPPRKLPAPVNVTAR